MAKFMDETPLAGMEAQMQQVPGFRPRKSGISVSRLEMLRTQGCYNGQSERQGDCDIIKQETSIKKSMNVKRQKACLNEGYLEKIIFG